MTSEVQFQTQPVAAVTGWQIGKALWFGVIVGG